MDEGDCGKKLKDKADFRETLNVFVSAGKFKFFPSEDTILTNCQMTTELQETNWDSVLHWISETKNNKPHGRVIIIKHGSYI
jgi:hypothetical protein